MTEIAGGELLYVGMGKRFFDEIKESFTHPLFHFQSQSYNLDFHCFLWRYWESANSAQNPQNSTTIRPACNP